MAKTLSLTGKNVKSFSGWLKKFSSIEKSLLIEIDIINQCFKAKSYNEEKSVVKYSQISFNEAGFLPTKAEQIIIRMGIYDVVRVMKSLDHFSSGEFDFNIQYDEVLDGNNEKNLAATSILLKNSSLKMKIVPSSLKVFNFISDDLFRNTIAHTDPLTIFDLSTATIDRINSLCDLDREYKFLEFLVKDKKVFVKGQAFELDIADNGDEKALISVYKEQFSKIDGEFYSVQFGEDKLVFESKDTETTTVLSMVVKDEKYEDVGTEF